MLSMMREEEDTFFFGNHFWRRYKLSKVKKSAWPWVNLANGKAAWVKNFRFLEKNFVGTER
jgi:NADPH-dependent 7-cyano-7-deazaguanine reductase QueF-like protein